MSEWAVLHGDAFWWLRELPAESVDAVVTDPPYGLEFMGKEWDSFGDRRAWDAERIAHAAERDREARKTVGPHSASRPGRAQARSSSAFGNAAGQAGAYDFAPRAMRAFEEWCCAWARELLRVLKPGGHLLAFGGTRTYHRLTCGLEDAGFEIRDCLSWLYGSGFPKSLDVSKAIDRAAGAEREVVGPRLYGDGQSYNGGGAAGRSGGAMGAAVAREPSMQTAPATPEAQKWQGWGTALKPAWEPIVLARKPLAGTVAGNVLEHGCGALNVDGCRIGVSDEDRATWGRAGGFMQAGYLGQPSTSLKGGADGTLNRADTTRADDARGRWPANVTLDPRAAAMLDEQSGESVSRQGQPRTGANGDGWGLTATGAEYDDRGGASRFFYIAKPSRAERNAGCEGFEPKMLRWSSGDESPGTFQSEGTDKTARNHHPTVKPIDLMRWLVRLVTPPGGVVLDPFTGSGTTGCAAVLEGFDFVGIEREAAYLAIAEARITWWEKHAGEGDIAELLDAAMVREAREREGWLSFDALDGEAA